MIEIQPAVQLRKTEDATLMGCLVLPSVLMLGWSVGLFEIGEHVLGTTVMLMAVLCVASPFLDR
ncbi:MAG: hypothetical protein ACYCW6_23795 [Candidatus Xenobia bacterium]